MVIIRMMGQLGNQMFYWALYRQLQHNGRNVKFDLEYYIDNPNQDMISKVFSCDVSRASKDEICAELDKSRNLFCRIRRRVIGRRNNILTENSDSENYWFNDKVFNLKRGYLDGYWQSEKYFVDVFSMVRKDFIFPSFTDERNIRVAQMIGKNVSVSIHVRRGDYLGLFPLLGMEYYHKAMSFFTEKYEKVVFYVFSNDIPWCRANFDDSCVFIDWNYGNESYNDMHLMSLCSHNIIANSSFSWWGAWLNKHENKQIIAPKVWFDHADNSDVYCKNWIVL